MRQALGRALFFILLMAVAFTHRRWAGPLLEVAGNESIVLVCIGLYPMLVLYWIHRHRLRFGLADLSAGFLSFGSALVPIHYLLARAGYQLREYPVIVLLVEIAIGVGFTRALKDRACLHGHFVRLRWLIFFADILGAASFIPALIMTVAMVMPASPFRNDAASGIAYFTLVMPVLISFWFWGIKEVRKSDKPIEDQPH